MAVVGRGGVEGAADRQEAGEGDGRRRGDGSTDRDGAEAVGGVQDLDGLRAPLIVTCSKLT